MGVILVPIIQNVDCSSMAAVAADHSAGPKRLTGAEVQAW